MSDSEIARLYNLCDTLQSDPPVGDEERLKGQDSEGRKKLLEEYDISLENPHPATHAAGYLFVHYAEGHNFNDFISVMVANNAETMTGERYDPVRLEARHAQPRWQPTALLQCMHTLATTTEVMSEFKRAFGADGTPEDQKKFFETHLPTNYYGEQEAVRTLMKTRKPDELLASMNLAVTTFHNEYQLCC